MQVMKVAKFEDADRVSFGDLAHYLPLIADGDTPMRTGIQVSEPGYVAPPHSHPYWEMLLILEGEAEAWMHEQPEKRVHLKAGDMIALPPDQTHSFQTVGDKTMRLLGIHHSPERVVNYLDRETDDQGYPVVPSS
ncbi:MAG TPA: cupin domain-containing protein [Alphaproteobacteria bacterium]|nr:cupin domain-containing protein [Alphaproteobacteria bacterium]